MKKKTSAVLLTCLLLLSVSIITEPGFLIEPAQAQASNTIVLKSGNGNPGDRDPHTQFTLDGGASYHDAFIVEPFVVYSLIPGTNYLSASPDKTLAAPGIIKYRTVFQLPPDFSNASISLQVHADNAATFYLNGEVIAQQPLADIPDNFSGPPESFQATDNSLFRAGTNVLDIEVTEFGVITALDYMAEITYSYASTLGVAVDIKPTSCPNPLKVGERGVLPAAILGSSEFDTSQIDPGSIKLAGVPAYSARPEDVATPYEGLTESPGANDCTTLGADGHTDLVLHFDHLSVTSALGPVSDGQVLVVKLTGNLKPEFGGAAIEGEDVVIIRKKK